MMHYERTGKTRTTRILYDMTDEHGEPAGQWQVVRTECWWRSCDGLGGRWLLQSENEEPVE